MKKLSILFIGALAALLSLAPVAGAKGKKHSRTSSVCGIVADSSVLPTTLVLATGGTRLVTIQNTKAVDVTAAVVGADVCARVKRVRTPAAPAARHGKGNHTAKTNVLVSVKVRPAASVSARGPVTLGTSEITVATLVFTFPAGFTLSPKVTAGKVVTAFGSAATAGGPIVLKKVSRKRHGHHARSEGGASSASATIAGRVSGLTPAGATTAGSITVGGIVLVIPAGKVLRASVTDGAFVKASAKVKNGVLSLKKVKVLSKAVTAPTPEV
jgi:hypothetical protein